MIEISNTAQTYFSHLLEQQEQMEQQQRYLAQIQHSQEQGIQM